jgi:hypothetical protein
VIEETMDRLERTALKIADDRRLLAETLLMALDYFEDRSDVYDGSYGEQMPNECMVLADTIKTALARVGRPA